MHNTNEITKLLYIHFHVFAENYQIDAHAFFIPTSLHAAATI